jgi:hypothetical protein
MGGVGGLMGYWGEMIHGVVEWGKEEITFQSQLDERFRHATKLPPHACSFTEYLPSVGVADQWSEPGPQQPGGFGGDRRRPELGRNEK